MSIILKGIDLPKADEVFYLTLSPDHKVIQMWKEEDNEYKLNQINKIQAVQIPNGHGRIGDLGKLAKLISDFGESLKESVRGNRLLMTERDLCHAIAVLTEHFQEYEPLLEAEE